MTTAVAVPLIVLLAVIVMMLAELWLSATNERVLRANGAVQADDPVYGAMRIAYPGVFVAMALEPSGNHGKARWLLRTAGPKLAGELGG